ncbi:WD40/YVTN/BNR-like repeat-containing protein [Natronorarus salvus]|uniref:WD40/YVTN/BNR-like repeat-containing protein n=1 Tax=Natronorarus salvus TaxID=3117733 RepID=UPI002F266BA1
MNTDRRTFIKLTGIAAASTTLAGQAVATGADWADVPTPTDATLSGVVGTREGPYAVGEGGLVLVRRTTGWEAVLETGPTTDANELNDVAATDDGRHVWFCGGSGVVGRYDTLRNEVTDYSGPSPEDEEGEKTSTWTALAAAGPAGEERVVLANGSGEVLPGDVTEDGGVDWGTVVEPGAGTTINGVSFLSRDEGFVCDSEGAVYETTDGGASWEGVGVQSAEEELQDLAVVDQDDVSVVASNGFVYEYDGTVWRDYDVGSETVFAVSRDGEDGLAVGASGYMYERTVSDDEADWERIDQPSEGDLFGVDLDTVGEFPDAAVGTGGTAVERGDYTALPQRLRLTKDVPASVDYELELVEGCEVEVETGEDDATVDECTVTGTLGNGDEHVFDLAGRIVDFDVTGGPLPQTNAEFGDDDFELFDVSPLRLADRTWNEVDSPVQSALYGVAAGAVPVAAGEEGRILRREDGDWFVVREDGPSGGSNPLNDAAATEDGDAVWVAGGSGAIGRYDVGEDELADYTAPEVEGSDGDVEEKTSTWGAVAVGGDAGEERIVLLNGSGEALPGEYTGDDVEWGQVVEPGGGSSIAGASFLPGSDTVYASDTNSEVFRSDDAGENWETIGVSGGSVAMNDVAAEESDDVTAAGGDGSVFRFNGAVWTKLDAGEEALSGIDRGRDRGVAAGGSGTTVSWTLYGWDEDGTPTAADLQDVVIAGTALDVAVGEDGAILERGRR